MRDIPTPARFALACVIAGVALGIRALLSRWLGGLQPFASGFVAVAVSVWFLGWGPAVLAAVVSFVGGTYLFVAPAPLSWLSAQELAAAGTYGLSAGVIIAVGHRARIAEQRLAEANAELRTADRKKDEFLATLSHELRNPVGVITGAIAALERGQHDERTRSLIAILTRQSAHIRRLVDDLLDVGRITRGRLTLRIEAIDIRACVADAASANRPQLDTRNQTLTIAAPDLPVIVQADGARIVQVISNLIDNASKYGVEGGTVDVRLVDNGAQVCIDVSDNGPGIAPEVMPHLFDIFEQGGGSSSGGLGLGLGLCKRLVEMHGGVISASANRTGAGTTLVVALPKRHATPSA